MRACYLLCLLLFAFCATAKDYDLVISQGRVIDPETQFDGVRNLGIRDGSIQRISKRPLQGKATIDARGLVVAPGFIDLHAHGQDPHSNAFQVTDGVTTALELEIGVFPVESWLASRAGKARAHFGASASHLAARIQATTGIEVGNPVYLSPSARAQSGDYANTQLDPEQLVKLQDLVNSGLANGALGIGIGITYTPGASHREILGMFEVAAARQVPVFTHIRQARHMGGDVLAPFQEVLANATATGAALHVVHMNSSLGTQARAAMQMLRGARDRGVDITTESYPYTAGSTRLESALFDDYQGDYSQLQWTATGERLTLETFNEYRKQGGWVIIHGRDEETNTWLVAQPDVMVASDGIPFVGDFSHPRSAGTFARVLGLYVREKQTLSLMSALAKMTILPAKRLQAIAPAMLRKGRVQEGADADLTLFDPEQISDVATYTVPARYSTGIEHVLVAGTAVVRNGELVEDAFPGQAIRAEPRL